MKKLMIAAAVAAIAVAGQAYEYNFTATMKTTKSVQGRDSKSATIFYSNDGIDQGGYYTYWYDDAEFDVGGQFEELVERTIKVKGGQRYELATIKQAKVNKLTLDEQVELRRVLSQYRNLWNYKGDYEVCLKLYFAEPAICYRTPTTKKYTGVLSVNDCCNATVDTYGASFADFDINWIYCNTDKEYVVEYTIYNGFHWVFAYRINGSTAADRECVKAKNIEAAVRMDWEDIDAWDLFGENTWGDSDTKDKSFALAGQGMFDVDNGCVKTLSGKIVGAFDAPLCGCCAQEKYSRVYSCDGFEDADYDNGEDYVDAGPNLLTAAFGDFTLCLR